MTLHFRDQRGAALPRYRNRAATTSLCVNRTPIWYGFRAGAKATCYSVNIASWCTGALSNVYDSYFKCLTGLTAPFDIKTNQPASTTPPFPSAGLVCLITSTITDPLSVLVLRISSSLLLGGDKTKGKERKNS